MHVSTHLSTHSSVVYFSTLATGLVTFILMEQFIPRHPSKHTQTPFAHKPLLEQLFGHNLTSQAVPANPGLHWHFPVASWQIPFLLQSSGQARTSQAAPPQDWAQFLHALQLHLPVIVSHVPWPEQSLGHFLWPQSDPKKFAWQVHVPLTHSPLPEHILLKSFDGQPFMLQSFPV